ncbi:MAG TPA: hypothetical protein VLG76_06520 [Rhabdochlamydiaceae bacterium]|nr:hypothetical protein [Rhabdochlamydiaceae bacterium]
MNGVIVGADRKIEWLLGFWWSHYKKHNMLPVTFVDFGMSPKAKKWCAARGSVVSLNMTVPIAPKSKIVSQVARQWEDVYGKQVWKLRQSWFKKPFALLQTPYERTLWLDLDCEVLGPLSELFDFCGPQIALVRETEGAHLHEKEQNQLLEGEILYNSGVIIYQKNAPLIQRWAEAVSGQNGSFWSDQQLLSRLIYLEKFKIKELVPEYNWRMSQGINFQALIIHWVGTWGKEFIRKHGGFSNYINNFIC